jgi:hypothetical protein
METTYLEFTVVFPELKISDPVLEFEEALNFFNNVPNEENTGISHHPMGIAKI